MKLNSLAGMPDKNENTLQELHEKIRKHFTRSERERKQYDADLEMADWWVCKHCGVELRYNPESPDTVDKMVSHIEQHQSDGR